MSRETPESAHPEELLASYVDGSIEATDRPAVDEHLVLCERCRHEVALATGAVEALRSLPEVAAPAGTTRSVTHELDRRAAGQDLAGSRGAPDGTGLERPSARRPGVPRLLAGLAAAAVVVALGAFVVGPLLSGSNEDGAASVSEAAPAASPGAADQARAGAIAFEGPPAVEQRDVDYDPATVAALASDAAADVRAGTLVSAAEKSASAPQPPGADAAVTCADRWASAGKAAIPIRVIEATYEGRPAYLAVAIQQPPQEPVRVLIWVLDRGGCDLISFSQQRT